MMHLPPQAYTKEMLIQAYNWLRSQPSHVQEMAKSPDALIALYSKAQIHGENYLSRTNLQGFKSELKNLANMMGEFDDSSPQSSAPVAPQGHSKSQAKVSMGHPIANAAIPPSEFTNPSQQQMPAPSAPSAGAPAVAHLQNNHPNSGFSALTAITPDPSLPLFNSMASFAPGQDLRSVLDARSWTMIQEVKNHFNLSNEGEAVRLLIAMGYQKMRSQF
jgi:hypothetical protein